MKIFFIEISAFNWYIAWGAIPFVLSVLLFWFTKSKASVSTQKPEKNKSETKETSQQSGSIISKLLDNPLGVMGINLTGAAALFFLVFVMMNPIKTGFYEKESNWKLRVSFRDDNGNFIRSERLKNIETVPTPIRHENFDANNIVIYLNDLREESAKIKVNYSLRITFDGYETYTIPLEDSINEGSFCQKVSGTKNIILGTRSLTTRIPNSIIPSTPDSAAIPASQKTIND